MDYKYGYLSLGVFLFLIWILFYVLRKDLRRKLIKVSLYGGLIGVISEYWYFQDYWHPYSILGRKVISPEDFIFGSTIAGISVAVYDIFFQKKDEDFVINNKKTFGIMFLISIASLFLFNIFLGFNSIFVSSIIFISLALFMLTKRPDLIKEAFLSGSIVLIMMFVVYHILFNMIFLDFWDKCWLLANTKYGITVYGNIPLTEMIWYFTWGSFSGVAYNFASGKKKIPL
ncbi:lycopene cyclase domain-containing protein [Flavobacterium sp.]|uniref:lycopene cyclase domain-containing protein n=1 Tax=Flavobacterium sp. TaxID=239 RepID=UPI00286DE010|nr:lycopene cyclase domain-containing protein [Flavobacterium sp.]